MNLKNSQMKLKSILIVIGLTIATMSFAQPQRGQRNPEEMAKRQTEQMVKGLGLDETQTVKVAALNEKYSNKIAEAFKSAGDDRTAMREVMQKMREEKEVELGTILTADQLKIYLELEKKRMEERKSHMKERKDGESSRRGQQRGTEK